jgi:protein TonB
MRKVTLILFTVLITGGCLFETNNEPGNCPVIHRDYKLSPTPAKGYEEAIEKRIQYPEMARKAGIEGRVYLAVDVNSEGKVIGTHVLRGIGGGCNEEAERVVSTAEFNPAVKNGRAVCSQDTMRVTFRLNN